MCNGLHGTHRRAKEAYSRGFETEYLDRKRECERLDALFREVAWYNFEVMIRKGRTPWKGSVGTLELHGVRIEEVFRRTRMEVGHFTVWYSGPSRDAPCLPLEILESERKLAAEELAIAKERTTAATDWSPGGSKYLQLIEDETGGAMAYERERKRARKSSKRKTE